MTYIAVPQLLAASILSPLVTSNQYAYETICGNCGDVGVQEAIITCCQCKNVHVHQYCVLAYSEDAPKDWCCEECDIGKKKASSSPGPENKLSEGSKLHATAKIGHSTVRPKKPKKFPSGHCINWEKEVQTGKTRYLSVEEALGLSSGVTKYGSLLKITGSLGPVSAKSMATVGGRNFNKPRAQIPNSFPEKSTVQRSLGAAGCLKPQNPQNAKITEMTKKPGQSSKGCDGSTILEFRSPDAVNASPMMIPPKTHPCDPAGVPSWKGSFVIFGDLKPEMPKDPIQAYPPSRVRRKVYEFSRLLPDTLQFELVPRGHIWSSLFHNRYPGKEDIGLYFFASERERSEKYIALVEFMHVKDLVMRAFGHDVELLVLASTTLCNDSRRFNSEHFLWGLFHHARQDKVGWAEGGSNEVSDMGIDMIGGEVICTSNEVDMEIDMIAGENVGRVDICVSKITSGNGFDSSLQEANEDDMEIDMVAGENIGRMDICVPKITSKNGCDSSFKETVSAAICNRSESVTLVSRTSKGGKELPRVDIKREPVDDFPPGFVPLLTPTK
ncbi:PHD finger-containing protein 1 isoform X1 [Nicotiana tomentosiformis]|uniref:PHD finger-containing protein 1 isoform X1 n=1 Tax=Nicotiana tomentosiformis TaxID=4098 RepID=UPI00051C115C|nr:uncharacterized protein LOC104091403 isoform X1 [Nicotiana tomentosiformis]